MALAVSVVLTGAAYSAMQESPCALTVWSTMQEQHLPPSHSPGHIPGTSRGDTQHCRAARVVSHCGWTGVAFSGLICSFYSLWERNVFPADKGSWNFP